MQTSRKASFQVADSALAVTSSLLYANRFTAFLHTKASVESIPFGKILFFMEYDVVRKLVEYLPYKCRKIFIFRRKDKTTIVKVSCVIV